MEIMSTAFRERLVGMDYVLVPVTHPESNESLLRTAVQLARGARRETGVLIFTVKVAATSDRECFLESVNGAPAGEMGAAEAAWSAGIDIVAARMGTRDAVSCVAALAEQLSAPLLLFDWSGGPMYSEFDPRLAKRASGSAPTAIIMLDARDLGQIRRILVPMDAGGDVELRIRLAHMLAGGPEGADVIVLHIVQPLKGIDHSIEEVATEDMIREVLGETSDRIRARVIEAPKIVDGVVAEVAEGFDLVIVGPSEQPRWRDWLFGSTPERIAEQVPCSVMLVQGGTEADS